MADSSLFFDNTEEEKEETLVDDLDVSPSDKEEEEEDNDSKNSDDGVFLSNSKLAILKRLLENIKSDSDMVKNLLSGVITSDEEDRISISQMGEAGFNGDEEDEEKGGGRIIEGVFDGENMIGPDGKQYSMPANYASKSKLVEGDILKLTITPTGTFVYKQIGPIERKRVVGQLEQDGSGNFIVVEGGKKWKVLTASVTYYKGKDGDEIVILVPKNGESKWAAVENIVRKTGQL